MRSVLFALGIVCVFAVPVEAGPLQCLFGGCSAGRAAQVQKEPVQKSTRREDRHGWRPGRFLLGR